MKTLDVKKLIGSNLILYPLSFLIILAAGCGEDENPIIIGGGGDTTTVANYNNLTIWGRPFGGFDTSSSAVDLFTGKIVKEANGIKDAVLIDSLGLDTNFAFRSGDLSDIAVPGYRTRFKFERLNMTQQEFDTLTYIMDSDSTLDSTDFGLDQTNYFQEPLVLNTVYGFYLMGKYQAGITPKRVFGLLYLDFADRDPNNFDRFRLRFDVKINKNGENRFARNPLP